jgi:hypothetical protein
MLLGKIRLRVASLLATHPLNLNPAPFYGISSGD